jgi:hypothetical protein
VERLREEVLGGKANLVVFFCNHCPYAKAVEDRLIALHRAFSAEGLRTVFICANDAAAYPDDAPAALRARAEDKAYPFPSLIDERQDIAKAFDAACTPDPYLYDANLKLVYRGRIDDNWKRPDAVTKHELRNAIEAVLSGAPVETLQHPSLGCSIKWKAA